MLLNYLNVIFPILLFKNRSILCKSSPKAACMYNFSLRTFRFSSGLLEMSDKGFQNYFLKVVCIFKICIEGFFCYCYHLWFTSRGFETTFLVIEGMD